MPERIHHYFAYDGEVDLPEEGVADFHGQPHYFWLCECLEEPRTGLFDVAPIDGELFALVNELGSMWHEWDLAYHAGKVELETHPMRAGSNPRYVELQAQVERGSLALRATSASAVGVVNTSRAYLELMQPFVGKKWPVPGTYSSVLEVSWREAP